MCKLYKALLCLFSLVIARPVLTQSINVVPNPGAPASFSWTGSGPLSGFSGNPVVLNNLLVGEYNAGITSDLSQVKQQLAVYKPDGSLQLISNPDAGQGVYFQSIHIVFDNKLFFIYIDAAGIQKLASFDGTSITVYPNPDASPSGFIGSPRILNNTLYVAYQNVSGVTQFGRFTGSGIALIANPDNSAAGFFNNYSVVYKNQLVGRYVTAGGPKQLAVFNGTSWTILSNPDNTPNRGVQPIFPTLYHDILYFTYYSNTGQYQLLKYDGTTAPSLIPNPQNSSSNNGGVTGNFTIIYDDSLFLQYRDIAGVYRLGKLKGNAIELIVNPDATTYGYWYTPIVFDGGLYIMYLPVNGSRHLARYTTETKSIEVIPNPDAGQGYWDQPFVYGNKLYLKYLNANSKFQLAAFDGNVFSLIANPPGAYNSNGINGYLGQPVIWNNKLFFQMGSVAYGYAGNLASYQTFASNGACAGINTSFTSNLTGASYQWQVDNGNGNFVNLTNGGVYSNVTGVTLSLQNPSTSLYGYKYRCQINGNTYSNVSILKFASYWIGSESDAWETAANWSCNAVPDANTDVYIYTGNPVLSSNKSVHSLTIATGSHLKIASNNNLTVMGVDH